VSDALNLYVGVDARHKPDWLVWQHDNYIGSFEGSELHFDAGFNWTITNAQELRMKLQVIGVDAKALQGYRVNSTGASIPTGEVLDDFSVRNLGFQLRYRFELAPLSYLYVVYGRGGYEQLQTSENTGRLVNDSFSLRDDDQLLVKLSYRFEP
jgi:hypothetical protein